MSPDRFASHRLSERGARRLAEEIRRDPEQETSLFLRFLSFLDREGIDGEARRIAIGGREESAGRRDRSSRRWGFILSGLAAAALVLSIGSGFHRAAASARTSSRPLMEHAARAAIDAESGRIPAI